MPMPTGRVDGKRAAAVAASVSRRSPKIVSFRVFAIGKSFALFRKEEPGSTRTLRDTMASSSSLSLFVGGGGGVDLVEEIAIIVSKR